MNTIIEPNKINTYPLELKTFIESKCTPDELNLFLIEKNYDIMCWHCTRLTDYEINQIFSDGLQFPTKDFFIEKIKNLPDSVRNSTKNFLIKYIENRKELQAENTICASYGKLDLKDDVKCDKIFTMNWGGETIYCAYDEGDSFKNSELKMIKDELDFVSYPCVIWFTITYRDLFYKSKQGYKKLHEFMISKNKKNICNSIYIDPCDMKIVNIEKLKK